MIKMLIVVLGLFVSSAYAANFGPFSYDDSGTAGCSANLNVSGALTVTGASSLAATTISTTLGVTGKSTLSDTITASKGVSSSTGTFSGLVAVSSAATSTSTMYFGGAIAALPTTGYSAGT